MIRILILLGFAAMGVEAAPALLRDSHARDGLVIFGSLLVAVWFVRFIQRRDTSLREWNERRIRTGVSSRR